MPRHLLIRLAPDGTAAWLALARDGAALHGEREGLPPPAEDVSAITVLVPAEDLLVLPLPTLPGSARQRQQALPFAIEEQLAAPVEQLHVALASQPDAVLVVARERMDAWLARLREAGLRPDRMLPDGWLLPCQPPTLLLHGARALLRDRPDRLLAMPVAELEQHFAILAAAQATPQPLQLLRVDSTAVVAAAVDEEHTHPELLPLLAARLGSAAGVDLLQHDYAPVHRHAGAQRRWRLAAALAGAALLLTLVHAFGEHRALESRWQHQQAQMQALYRSVVPGTTPVPDAAARLRSLIETRGAAGAGSGALALLAQVAPALSGSGRFTIDAVEYRGGALELTLRAPDVATLDALRARLSAQPPLQAELTGLVPGSNGVEGRLRVRTTGPA